MSPLPHFFGLDFTGAGSWLIVGLLAGYLLSWLWRALRGSRLDAKALAKIGEVEALLDTSRSEHQADVARLLSDARNFEQALADAERRAAAGSEKTALLSTENQRLSQAELASRNDLLAADGEMAKLKSALQWAESQARGAGQDRQAFEKQIITLNNERQLFNGDLATARTAAELKDAEIARLINQVHWHENRATALEQEKLGLTSSLTAASSKDADIAQLKAAVDAARAELATVKGHLGSAQTTLANFRSDAASGSESLGTVQAKYDQSWKDLNYMRNLAYWQTSEIDRLRKAITAFESDVAAKAAMLATLNAGHAALKAKVTRGRPSARGHLAYFRGLGMNGTSADAHGHAKGAGKIAFLHVYRPDGAGKKATRAKANKLGKTFAAAGLAGRAKGSVLAGRAINLTGNTMAARRVGFAEVQGLKAKVAELTEDAAKYRRLREAVHVANRIADETV